MTSEELAEETSKFISEAIDRVVGTGNAQYSLGKKQVFEGLDLDVLFQSAYEELQDVAAYATMLYIRLKRLESAVKSKNNEDYLNYLKRLDCL
jgi:hypothetical protein